MVLKDFPPRGGEPELALEDPEFLVLKKPAGMHTAPGSPDGAITLAGWVFERYPDAGRVSGRGRGEGGLLHRLDGETSGLVLFARTEEAFQVLSAAAEAGNFRKVYRLRACPSLAGLPGSRPERSAPTGPATEDWERCLGGAEAVAELLAATLASGRPVVVESRFRAYGPRSARVACAPPGEVPPGGKGAWGEVGYRTDILDCTAALGALDLSVSLTRGFRHQIRAHLAWIGLPLLGDPLYGGRNAERLYLSAAVLEFPHPRTGAVVRVEA